MKLTLELEFPDEQAANVLYMLQSIPNVTVRFLTPSIAAAPDEQSTRVSGAE